MRGSTMGDLNVYIQESSNQWASTKLWSKSGNQGTQWQQASGICIKSSSQYQIVFEAVRGSSFQSDVAIDDINFTNCKCIGK
jgi:hypothetical protein